MEIAEQHAGKITIVEVKGRIDGNTARGKAVSEERSRSME